MGRRHASVVARQRRTENLDRIILPANDRLACNGPCDGVSGELYNPPDINELSLPFAFKVLVRGGCSGAFHRLLTYASGSLNPYASHVSGRVTTSPPVGVKNSPRFFI